MSVALTPSQQAAVDNEGGSLLVSAAAGSGKTRVLVERLFRRITGPEQANVDDFLMITYTRAAAAELKDRIAQELNARLAEEPGSRHLRRQTTLVYHAGIKTIDAFCTGFLREYIHLLDLGEGQSLTADFRVLDEAEAELLRQRVLPRTLERFYDALTPAGRQLADAFGFGRDDQKLEDLVLELHRKLQSHPYPEQWLLAQKKNWADIPADISGTLYGQTLLAGARRKAIHWARIFRSGVLLMEEDEGIEKAYAGVFCQEAAMLEAFSNATERGWREAGAMELVWNRLPGVRKCQNPVLKARLQSQRNRCKKEMAKVMETLSTDAEEAAEELRRTAPAMEALLDLTAAFSADYQREKLRRGVTDFSDQEHYAVSLLLREDGTPTELAETISRRYREVMVDEYQDTNQVQNCIFTAISQGGRRLFAVGDVKQSIYRFRLADPTIFLEKYRTYPPAGQEAPGAPRKILLSQNFRSRQPVLDAANFIFSAIMSQEMGEIDYGEEERLYFGADYLPPREDGQTEFHLLSAPYGRGAEGGSRALLEARFVARRIRQMLDKGYPVADNGGMRPCRPDDIVVLMRSPGPRLSLYARAFAETGVPFVTQENEDFFSTLEVAAVLSLLEILDNPRQDIPLIAILRSPLFSFSPDKLAMIRGNHQGDFYDALCASEDEECQLFLCQLEELRTQARDASVHQTLWRIYNKLNVLGIFGAMPEGSRRRENLVALTQHALSFESAGYKGLFAFVSHLRFLLENGQQPLTAAGSAASGVRLMSIHKSKGLEFPIVFVADLHKGFNTMDLKAPVLIHPQLGLGPMYIDLERHIRYPTCARDAVAAQLSREARSEEMRILYVALTRAKEKLILVATMTSAEKKLANLTALSALPVPPETVDAAGSMAEWILLPLLRRPEAKPLRQFAGMEEGDGAALDDAPWLVALHDAEDYAVPLCDAAPVEGEAFSDAAELPFDPAALEYVYPYAAASLIPAKLTATQLKGREKDEEIAEGTPPPYIHHDFPPPRFLTGQQPLTAAQKGTAAHTVLQYLPLNGDPAAVVRDLTARRLLTPDQAAAVHLGDLRRFLASPLAQTLRGAKNVVREYRFSLLTEGKGYYPDLDEGEEILLQGVVDLYAEMPGGVLVVDFKTDYITKETLADKAEHYRPQLLAYSAALEKILEQPVIHRILYFLRTGDTVEL